MKDHATRYRATWRAERDRWVDGVYQVLDDSGLVRDFELSRVRGGYRVRGRIHPAWWLALGAKHLSVRSKLKTALPMAREYSGVMLPIESVVVL